MPVDGSRSVKSEIPKDVTSESDDDLMNDVKFVRDASEARGHYIM